MSKVKSYNESALYCHPAKIKEIVMEKWEDTELNAIANARLSDGQELIRINFDLELVGKRERNTVYRMAAKR